jgi:hypothetical protein
MRRLPPLNLTNVYFAQGDEEVEHAFAAVPAFHRILRLGQTAYRTAGAAVVLATIPWGLLIDGPQLAALLVVLLATLTLDARTMHRPATTA